VVHSFPLRTVGSDCIAWNKLAITRVKRSPVSQCDAAIGMHAFDRDDFAVGHGRTGRQPPVRFQLELIAVGEEKPPRTTDGDSTELLIGNQPPLAVNINQDAALDTCDKRSTRTA